MDGTKWQVGKTRYARSTTAYHLVWRAKYRRRVLTGEAQKETTCLWAAWCEQHRL